MPLREEQKRAIMKQILRLVMKNADAKFLISAAYKGLVNGNFDKEVLSRVFAIDTSSTLPVEHLVMEALFERLAEEDIEDLFQRYARRTGQAF